MSCRDIHATNVFAFIIALVSVGGLLVATLIPQWRVTKLITFNKHARNVTVYDGLWAKCVRQDGNPSCYFYDSEWYARVDQLDLRILQFALPFSLFFSSLALLLMMCGMCKTACCSAEPAPEAAGKSRCLVNSAGCHLVAGMFLLLAGGIAMAPSVWFLFYTKEMNKKYDNVFSDDFAVFVAIGCSGGLLLAALLLFMWYCMCKRLPSPFWLPLPAMSHSFSTQPLTSNGYPSPVYAPQTYAPQVYAPAVLDAQSQYAQSQYAQSQYAQSQYAQSVAPQAAAAHGYVSQISAPDGYGSEAGASQAYTAHSYAPSQAYGSSYGGGGGARYSTRSRLSAIEIDIPVLQQEH